MEGEEAAAGEAVDAVGEEEEEDAAEEEAGGEGNEISGIIATTRPTPQMAY